MEGNRIIEKTTYRKLRTSIVKKRFFFYSPGAYFQTVKPNTYNQNYKEQWIFPHKEKTRGKEHKYELIHRMLLLFRKKKKYDTNWRK